MKKAEIIKMVQAAMKDQYGITLHRDEILLTTWNDSGSYVAFDVGDREYVLYEKGEPPKRILEESRNLI